MKDTILIAHNIRSALNVGSIIRASDGLGVKTMYLSGVSPHPRSIKDQRLPHEINKAESKIFKTSLGSEKNINITYVNNLQSLINKLKSDGYDIVGLEQTKSSVPVNKFTVPNKIAVIVGSETTGLDNRSLSFCNQIVQIPMLGKKESFNVVQAATIFLFYVQLKRKEYDIIS